ncbi:MAG: CoA transferase [Alphaproteobacteria bacterium]|nr:CoA transferase [Alphaproteobacteria bacterium]MCY3754550.1 CoA transferase [Alphaproteobacteria bacterium]
MPLSGLTVIEIGQNIAGPYAGAILADLGADVIKIEKPGGDDARFWFVEKDGERHPLAFHILNRNKRSAVVDFKEEAALRRFLALVERADVLLHNLRPGLAESLGIGHAALEARNPRLVYCEVGAFGRAGPLASKPGYEPLAHAYAGVMAMNGPVEGPPMRAGVSIVDPGTAMWAVIGILAALRRRERTGEGGRVDVSLFETGLGWVYQPLSDYLFTGREPERQGNGNSMLTPYQVFETATDPVMVAAGNDRLYQRLCAVLGRPEWGRDARFATVRDRLTNRAALIPLIQLALLTRPRAVWQAALEAAGVPHAPINKVSEAADDPQTAALGAMLTEPETGYPLLGLPVSLDGERPPVRSRAPALGAHTRDVFGADG